MKQLLCILANWYLENYCKMKTKIEIKRKYDDKQTSGILKVIKGEEVLFECFTLELPWLDNKPSVSCIPEGTYKGIKRDNKPNVHYKDAIEVHGVPERSAILIHQGNYAGSFNPKTGRHDIRGCILVGENFKDIDGDDIVDIVNSKNTLLKLLQHVPKEFEIEIKKI